MRESGNNPEDFIEKVLKESPPTAVTSDEERIARTVARAQRKTNTRDIMLLVFVRFWMVLAEVTCKVFAKTSKPQSMKKPWDTN